MTNKCIIDSSLVCSYASNYVQYAEMWAPVKAIKNIDLLRMVEWSNYLVDTKEQIDFLMQNNVEISKYYFGTFKSLFDLDYAILKGIKKFVVASTYELKTLSDKAHQLENIFLSINALNFLNVSDNRVGFSFEELTSILNDPSYSGKIGGLAFHLQEPHKTVENYLITIKKILPLIEAYRLKLNLGGLPYKVLEIILSKIPVLKKYSIIVEPGNSLFSDAATIETQVIYVDASNKIINLNIGIYNGLLDCKLLNKPIKVWQDSIENDAVEKFDIFGPTSDNLDYLGQHFLKKSTQIGDKIFISNCGIYSIYLNTDFYHKKMTIEIK